jgi:predicted dehydrogenase
LLRPLRIGIAGIGFGAAVHLPALRSLPGVTVATIAGTRPDKTGEIARKCGVARALHGLLASGELGRNERIDVAWMTQSYVHRRPGDSRLPPFRALAERFVDAVSAGSACQPDFAAGARVQRLVADIEAPTHIGHAARRVVV